MWTVVYVSQNKVKVDKIVVILNDNSIMTMLKSNRNENADTVSYEILVPQTELEAAQDIIFDTEISDGAED